ncbi:MAG TPA: 50S ribosomal protein L15 [Tepidisphaeraceae bacterium]|nr:50S ribosomal protein L15 [Tepidisphaeraceae bacterium]
MIHEITKLAPRNKRRMRKGRGESSGKGKTSGRGNKGAKARVGTYIKRGHEGGQTPIFRRFPKRGFSNHDFERRFHIVNLSSLNDFADGAVVDALALKDKGLIPDLKRPVKILGDGKLEKKLTVVAAWYSKQAHARIGAAGGAAQNASGQPFEFPKPKKVFVPREPVKKKVVEADAAAPAPAAAPAVAPAAEPAKPSAE